jgi:hypothetical protein
VQAVDAADFVQDGFAQLEAVADRRRLRQIEQRASQHRVLDVEIDAANQVGRVFLLRQIARRRTRRTALGQGKDGRTVGVGTRKRVGMDRE